MCPEIWKRNGVFPQEFSSDRARDRVNGSWPLRCLGEGRESGSISISEFCSRFSAIEFQMKLLEFPSPINKCLRQFRRLFFELGCRYHWENISSPELPK